VGTLSKPNEQELKRIALALRRGAALRIAFGYAILVIGGAVVGALCAYNPGEPLRWNSLFAIRYGLSICLGITAGWILSRWAVFGSLSYYSAHIYDLLSRGGMIQCVLEEDVYMRAPLLGLNSVVDHWLLGLPSMFWGTLKKRRAVFGLRRRIRDLRTSYLYFSGRMDLKPFPKAWHRDTVPVLVFLAILYVSLFTAEIISIKVPSFGQQSSDAIQLVMNSASLRSTVYPLIIFPILWASVKLHSLSAALNLALADAVEKLGEDWPRIYSSNSAPPAGAASGVR
jgi:hypothetical protein